MTHLRRRAIYLVVFLAVFFNLERLDFGERNLIDISSIAYVLAVGAVAVILAWPPLQTVRRRYLLAGILVLDLSARMALWLGAGRPLVGGIHTYVTITEAVLLLVTVWLARDVTRALRDFEEAVRNLTLADLSHRVQHLHQGYEDIQRELQRSRRHDYPLSVLVVEPDTSSVDVALNRTVLEVQQSMMTRYVMTNLIRITSHTLRRSDLIFDQPGEDQFVLLLPDTGTEDALLFGERLSSLIREQLGVSVRFGLASFPSQALTFEDLVEHAEKFLNTPHLPTDQLETPKA